MYYRKMWITACVVCVVSVSAAALEMKSLPDRDAPLHERIEAIDDLVRTNHWNEGLILPCVIFPPAGEDRPVTGNHEDVAELTATYLAAYAHRYAVTKDPQVRKTADMLMDAILNLEKVTGVPGVCARGYYKTDKPLWHEKAFFFPLEWHASETMPGYRWVGDLSSDKFVTFFYGVGIYWELCADDEHKQIAADFIDRFVGCCVDHNFKLVDVDNKMTLWGNFCPDLPHENLNALEMLAGLKVAYRMTGKGRYSAAYQRLIDEYHYDDEAIMAKVLWPKEWQVSWDDHLAAKSLYMLIRYETDPSLLQKYHMSLNRHWFDWKQRPLSDARWIWYPMLYEVLTGKHVVDEKVKKAVMNNLAVVHRAQCTYTIPTPEGNKTVQAQQEEISASLFRTYWFGRQHGFIDADW